MGILLPAPIGAWIFQIVLTFAYRQRFGPEAFIILPGLAYAFVGIQSIIYSYIMEYYVNAKFSSNLIIYICSAVLGAITAASITIITGAFLRVTTIGLVTGLIVGIILRACYKQAANE